MVDLSKIGLAPGGKLFLELSPDSADEWTLDFEQRFHRSPLQSLLELAAQDMIETNANLAYWQGIILLFIRELFFQCHARPDPRVDSPPPLDLSPLLSQIEKILEKAPVDPLWEQVQAQDLALIFKNLLLSISPTFSRDDFLKYFQRNFPQFLDLGRLHLHIAEQEKDGVSSFFLLMTVADQIQKNAPATHRVVGEVLREQLTQEATFTFAPLMSHLQSLAAGIPAVAEALRTGKLSAPLGVYPQDIGWILQHMNDLTSQGIVVKVPRTWQDGKRFNRPRLEITVQNTGSNESAKKGLNLHFRFDLAGLQLSEAEFEEILNRQEQLLFLKNQWVYLDRHNIKAIVDRLRLAQSQAQQRSISLSEALKMIAFLPVQGQAQNPESSDPRIREGGDTVDLKLESGPLETLHASVPALDSMQLSILKSDLRASLRPYQQQGVAWLWQRYHWQLGACLADDMGLGKTIQIIAHLCLVKRQNQTEPQPHLIVCPPTLIANWQQELIRFAPHLNVQVLRYQKDQRLLDDATTDIFLCSLYLLRQNPELFSNREWGCLILDEAQSAKNPLAKISQALRQIPRRMAIAITGTPIENSMLDLWSLFDFFIPGYLGSFQEFSAQLSSNHLGALKHACRPFLLRRLKTDKKIIQDLPDKNICRVYCELSKEQAIAYDQVIKTFKKDLAAAGDDLKEKRRVILPVFLHLRQICLHADFYLKQTPKKIEPGEKMSKLVEILRPIARQGDKVLIFTQFASLIPDLHKFIQRFMALPIFWIKGDDSQKTRQDMMTQFKAENSSAAMLISLKAGGTGLNLTEANHVIHLDRWWNPAVEDQASDRAFRIGQKKNVFIYHLINQGTLEQGIDEMLRRKSNVAESFLSENLEETSLFKLKDHELLQLFSRQDS